MLDNLKKLHELVEGKKVVLDNLKKLHELVEGKKVFLATHWDADGITSGSMVFHLIKDKAKEVKTISKGVVFRIDLEDVPKDSEIVICTDIRPSVGIKQPVVYIDHHPCGEDEFSENNIKQEFALKVYDKGAQSCSLVVWKNFLKNSHDPYFIFLTLLGFFGDGGDNNEIPIELESKALDSFPELMVRQINYGSEMMEIERYVSALNTGKRMHWDGQVPFELFKNIDCIEPFTKNLHPLALELQNYRQELRELYEMDVKVHEFRDIDFIKIDCDKNIQGVLCARYMRDKPILVMNQYNGSAMASMRVPEEVDFDAGNYLSSFIGKIPDLVGGGHSKAGGISFPAEHLDKFLDLLKED